MRDAIQLELTVSGYHDAKRAERQRLLVQVLTILSKSHDQDWWIWCEAFGRQEHAHGLKRADGKPAACPVHGCEILEARAA